MISWVLGHSSLVQGIGKGQARDDRVVCKTQPRFKIM